MKKTIRMAVAYLVQNDRGEKGAWKVETLVSSFQNMTVSPSPRRHDKVAKRPRTNERDAKQSDDQNATMALGNSLSGRIPSLPRRDIGRTKRH